MTVTAEDFGNDFAWGVSTAAYQIEGAHRKDGKGFSVWDEFANTKGKIFQNQNGNIACNFYENAHQDLALMRAMNIPNFRFSISWPRIFPDGTGAVNKMGIDFYNRVIDFCLELEITPWITLYHWDLPLALEQKGGWTNRDVVGWFTDYVSLCVKKFGDRVNHWMVLNEPMAFTGAGYFLGIHAPGRKGLTGFLRAAHHAALCQAEGGRVVRSLAPAAKVGTTFSFSHISPLTQQEDDVLAAGRMDAILNRFFIEPLLGFGYPYQQVKILNAIEDAMKDGDEQKLPFQMDFIGVQNYTREVISHSYFNPFVHARVVKASERDVEHTAMNWEVYPPSIYLVLKRLAAYPGIPRLVVTENGAAFKDAVVDGHVHDEQREIYLKEHISQVYRAKSEGVDVNGYFVWTFMDNFEWAEGYRPRFGLVYVDYPTQKRIVKKSGLWYAGFLSGRKWIHGPGHASAENIRHSYFRVPR